MTATNAVATIETRELARGDDEWSVERIVEQARKIQECMKAVMIRDEHYGVIPGTKTKPTLLKPGAEKLCLMFRLCPEYETENAVQTATLISFRIRCSLRHIPTDKVIATGMGSCNSREKKYTRPAAKVCPNCSKQTIFKSKNEGEGWYCWRKKDGCGATFKPEDQAIVDQDTGVEDPSDLDNTILKMACKRALVAAVLNGTAASDCFTQDLEDLTEKAAEYIPPPPKEAANAPAPKAPATAAVSVAYQGATATTSTSGAMATSKPPRADMIPHDGNLASGDQVKALHTLKSKLQMGDCDGKCAKEVQQYSKRAKGTVPKTVYCIYHTQLAAFKDEDGKPCRSSKDLSRTQISNLIDRYEARITNQAARADQGVDIGALVADTPAPTLGSLLDRHWPIGQEDECFAWLHATFGKDHPQDLDRDESATALQLLIAMSSGDEAYNRAEETARAMGKIR